MIKYRILSNGTLFKAQYKTRWFWWTIVEGYSESSWPMLFTDITGAQAAIDEDWRNRVKYNSNYRVLTDEQVKQEKKLLNNE